MTKEGHEKEAEIFVSEKKTDSGGNCKDKLELRMNEKINNFLQAIITIAKEENTAESNAIKEIAIEISNIFNREDKN